MQWIHDKSSAYRRRLNCTGFEIDEIMEERYLKFFGGKCNIDHPALDIECFIDTLRGEDIEYEPEAIDLASNVLGATKFYPSGTRLIQINVNLSRQKKSLITRGRFRFTCAHEVFHSLFHYPIFSRGGHLKCFEENIRENIVEPGRISNDFIEWQANRGAAALLMPSSIFKENFKRICINFPNHDSLVRELALRFDVSRQSVQIRLQTLKLIVLPEDDFVLQHDGIDSYRDNRKISWN